MPERRGFKVGPASLLTGWDTTLLMAPFGALLGAWMFGLDELLTAPRARRRRAFSLTDLDGREALTDPDGRPWKVAASREKGKATRTGGGKVQRFEEGQTPSGEANMDVSTCFCNQMETT